MSKVNNLSYKKYLFAESAAFVSLAYIAGKTRCIQFFPDTTFGGFMLAAGSSSISAYYYQSRCRNDKHSLFLSLVGKTTAIGIGVSLSVIFTNNLKGKPKVLSLNGAFKMWGMECGVVAITQLWQRVDVLNRELASEKKRAAKEKIDFELKLASEIKRVEGAARQLQFVKDQATYAAGQAKLKQESLQRNLLFEKGKVRDLSQGNSLLILNCKNLQNALQSKEEEVRSHQAENLRLKNRVSQESKQAKEAECELFKMRGDLTAEKSRMSRLREETDERVSAVQQSLRSEKARAEEAEKKARSINGQLRMAKMQIDRATAQNDRLTRQIAALQNSRSDGASSLSDIVVDESKIQAIQAAVDMLTQLKGCSITDLNLTDNVRKFDLDELLKKHQSQDIYSGNFNFDQLFMLDGQQVIEDAKKTTLIDFLNSSDQLQREYSQSIVNIILLKIRLWEALPEGSEKTEQKELLLGWLTCTYKNIRGAHQGIKGVIRVKLQTLSSEMHRINYDERLFDLEGQQLITDGEINSIIARLNKYFISNPHTPIAHYAQSIFNIVLLEKHIWETLPEGYEKDEQKGLLEDRIRGVCTHFIDAHRDCADQTTSQLENLAIEVATWRGCHIEALAGLNIIKYRHETIRRLMSTHINPTYGHVADIERQLKRIITEALDLPRPEIQNNVAYSFATKDTINFISTAFFDQYLPKEHLFAQLTMHGNRKLHSMMAKWYSDEFFKSLNDANGDVINGYANYHDELIEAIGCDPEMIGFEGKDFNDQAKLYFLTQNNVLNSPS